MFNNPNVAYLLLMLGFYGLFFELSNPGAIFPGVAGGICLILGLFALQNLSINYAGLLLIVFGAILFFLETQITSHGLLAVGGTVSLLMGSLLLIDAPEPYLRVSLKVIIPAVGFTAAFFFFAVDHGRSGPEKKGRIRCRGSGGSERRLPHRPGPRGQGVRGRRALERDLGVGGDPTREDPVEVVAVDHLRLTVRPSAG